MGESVDGERVGSFRSGGDAEEGSSGGGRLRGEWDFEEDSKEREDVGVWRRRARNSSQKKETWRAEAIDATREKRTHLRNFQRSLAHGTPKPTTSRPNDQQQPPLSSS